MSTTHMDKEIEEKDDLFADLPTGEEEEIEDEPTPEEKEKLKQLDKAAKEEESRLAKAKQKLDETRKARKEAEEALSKAEKGEEAPAAPTPVTPPVNVGEEVAKALESEKRKEHLKAVADQIRGMAKDQKEARAAYDEAIKLPPTGDAKLDAEFAFDRIQKLKTAKRGFNPPSMGGSFADLPASGERDDAGLSKGQLANLQERGISPEDAKKYKDGVKFDRMFTKR